MLFSGGKSVFLYTQNVFSIHIYATCMEPRFADVYDGNELIMIEDAYRTIKTLNLWDWFTTFEPHPNEGFMFTADINIATIGTSLKYKHHSGASFGWTMRIVHDIAKHGWEKHRQAAIAKRCSACPCRQRMGLRTGWCGVAGGGVPACDH